MKGIHSFEKITIQIIIFAFLISIFLYTPAIAALVDNHDGTITQIRDDGTTLMWLNDFSLSGYQTSNNIDWQLTWSEAVEWADQLVFAGYDDWRLPSVKNFDGSDPIYGFNVTTSEMGNLYYIELGGTVGDPDGTSHLATEGPFINIHYVNHWASEIYAPKPENRWGFGFGTGIQADVGSQYTINYTVAVRDIEAVPIPSALWLLAFGLFGIVGLRNRQWFKSLLAKV